jgi:hypothetical protein
MGNWEANWDRGALERIVALLFALANLADLAAGAPFLRRRQVLGILNCGEVEARAFVVGMVCGEPVPADALEQTGDVARLAVRLRALALMLAVLLLARRSALPGTADPRSDRPLDGIAGPAVRCAPALPALDTS